MQKKYDFTTKWETVGSPTKEVVTDGGSKVASLRGGNSHDNLIVNKDKTFDNFIFEAKVKMTADDNNLCSPEISLRYTDVDNRYIFLLRGETVNDVFSRRHEGGSVYSSDSSAFNFTVRYYNLKIIMNGADRDVWLDDTHVTHVTDAGSNITSGKIGIHNYRNDNAAYFDNVRVRKYASPEPTVII